MPDIESNLVGGCTPPLQLVSSDGLPLRAALQQPGGIEGILRVCRCVFGLQEFSQWIPGEILTILVVSKIRFANSVSKTIVFYKKHNC